MIHNLYPDKEAAQQVAEAQSGKGPQQQPTVTEVKKDAGQPLNTTLYFQVQAYDAAGNRSSKTASVAVIL